MEIMKHAQVGLFLFAITASGLTLANCPGSMPLQLLEDCIVVEGSGSNFPHKTYHNMELDKEWQVSELAKLESTAAGVARNDRIPQTVAE